MPKNINIKKFLIIIFIVTGLVPIVLLTSLCLTNAIEAIKKFEYSI
ncbi:hypothetical protein ACER0A_007875 [Haloimpatiens sp. FM7315]